MIRSDHFRFAHTRGKALPATLAGLLFSAFALVSTAGLAGETPNDEDEEETRRVTAEVIVFARTDAAAREEERPGTGSARPDIEGSIDPADPDAELDWNTELGRLAGIRERLDESDDYEVLTFGRWTQEERERENAPLIRLSREDEELQEDPGETGVYQDPHRSGLLDPDELRAPPETPLRRPLDGTFQVYRGRFFHAHVDLVYHPDEDELEELLNDADEEPSFDRRLSALPGELLTGPGWQGQRLQPDEPAFQGFRMTEQRRRLRLQEVHYLDHPVLGVILHLARPED